MNTKKLCRDINEGRKWQAIKAVVGKIKGRLSSDYGQGEGDPDTHIPKIGQGGPQRSPKGSKMSKATRRAADRAQKQKFYSGREGPRSSPPEGYDHTRSSNR